MAAIGFLAPRPEEKQSPVIQERPTEQVVQFDSGSAIHFDEAAHNTLVLGSTGSGKTSNAILPACRKLFQAGFGGLIIDIKGNLTDQIRRIAQDCRRADDIVEFGTANTARKGNILDNLSSKDAYEFFKTIGQTMYQPDDHNSYWHMQGLKMAADVLEVLRTVKTHHKENFEVPADVLAVNEVLNNPELAWRIFHYFTIIHEKDCPTPARDINNPASKRLIKKVNADAFHIFKEKKEGDEHYDSQTSWRLAVIRNALDIFAETPGMENFSAQGEGIDLEQLIYTDKKIVVLSFDAAAGEIARALSRHLIESYYKAVLKRGLGLSDGQYTFLIADEFQDSANFDSDNSWNDNVFTAKSREFRSIQIFASQSLASLVSRGASLVQVEEFLNNCNNRLFFYGDDTLTQQVVARFDESIHLPKLNTGQCFTVRYDLSSRRHLSGLETLQCAHDGIKTLFLASDELVSTPKNIVQPRMFEDSVEYLFYKTIPIYRQKQRGLQPGGQKRFLKARCEKQAAARADLPKHIRTLVDKYPAFFQPDCYSNIEIPVGWAETVEKAIQTVLQASGGKVNELGITAWTGARFGHPGLHAYTQKQSFAVPFLNKLLTDIHFCPLCGAKHDGVDKSPLCKKCSVENDFCINNDQDVVPS